MREGLTTELFVRQLEDRRVLNAHSLPLPAVAGILLVDAGSHAAKGQAETIDVSRQGNDIDIAISGQKTIVADLHNFDVLWLQGLTGQDTFILDLSGGDPLPSGGVQPLSLVLGAHAGDTIDITGQNNLGGGNLTVTGGSIQVDGTLTSHGGAIALDAGRQGTLLVSGAIDVSSPQAGGAGGTVHLLGGQVDLVGSASVNASGDGGGGTILVARPGHPVLRVAAPTRTSPTRRTCTSGPACKSRPMPFPAVTGERWSCGRTS